MTSDTVEIYLNPTDKVQQLQSMDIKIYSKLELVNLWNLQNLMSHHYTDGLHQSTSVVTKGSAEAFMF